MSQALAKACMSCGKVGDNMHSLPSDVLAYTDNPAFSNGQIVFCSKCLPNVVRGLFALTLEAIRERVYALSSSELDNGLVAKATRVCKCALCAKARDLVANPP